MTVTIYTLPNCVACDTSKRMMDRMGVAYETVDLSSNEEAASKVADLGYKQAPVVVTEKTHWSGFNFEKLQSLKVLAQ